MTLPTHLYPVIPAVGHYDVPLVVHGDAVGPGELTVLDALGPQELERSVGKSQEINNKGRKVGVRKRAVRKVSGRDSSLQPQLTWAPWKSALITSRRWLLKSVTTACRSE